jgi:catechol 2,3-dioxygenase-like lactoylglutathione lyase family enzyme
MLLGLDHVNVRTPNLEHMIRFYCDVLGMKTGPRPAFSFNGAWLYCGERAVVHLVEIDEHPRPSGELRLEHFAFSAAGLRQFVQRLQSLGIEHRLGVLPTYGTHQVTLRDPDGNRLHIDFSPEESLPGPLNSPA